MQPQVLLGYYYKAEPKYNHLKGIEKRTPKDDHMAHSAFAQQTVDLGDIRDEHGLCGESEQNFMLMERVA